MNISAGLGRSPPVATSSPTPVPGSMLLALRSSDLDAALARLYHDTLGGAPQEDILMALCQQLSSLLNLRLAVLARRLHTGAMAMDAASKDNALWLELQHIPERWDSGLSSLGPAGECLRTGSAIRMKVDSEAFALWRTSAIKEQIVEVLALPLAAPAGPQVLELYFLGPIPEGARVGTLSIDALIAKLSAFLADLGVLRQQALLARALTCAGNSAFVTDLEGTIVWCNPAFSELSGFTPEDMVGRNPNVLRSGEQGLRYYRDLWSTIRSGKVWSGETVDRAKDGHSYVIQQTISPVSQGERVTHYLSMHQDIGRERRQLDSLELASQVQPGSGLLTRKAFERAAERALAETGAESWTLVLVSARGLRHIAHTLDADTGELLGALISRRLREFIKPDEHAGLHGEFEYALLLRGPGESAEASGRLLQLAEMLREPLPLAGGEVDPEAHLATAQFRRDGETLRALLRQADRKLADEPSQRASRRVQ